MSETENDGRMSFAEAVHYVQQQPGRAAFVEYARYEADHERFGEYQPIRCLVRWPWKIVLNLHATDELYNLERDPHEMDNLVDSPAFAGERDRMHDSLLDEMDRSRDPWRGSYWEIRAWREKPLLHPDSIAA
mgnify:CR=1 FL=1